LKSYFKSVLVIIMTVVLLISGPQFSNGADINEGADIATIQNEDASSSDVIVQNEDANSSDVTVQNEDIETTTMDYTDAEIKTRIDNASSRREITVDLNDSSQVDSQVDSDDVKIVASVWGDRDNSIPVKKRQKKIHFSFYVQKVNYDDDDLVYKAQCGIALYASYDRTDPQNTSVLLARYEHDETFTIEEGMTAEEFLFDPNTKFGKFSAFYSLNVACVIYEYEQVGIKKVLKLIKKKNAISIASLLASTFVYDDVTDTSDHDYVLANKIALEYPQVSNVWNGKRYWVPMILKTNYTKDTLSKSYSDRRKEYSNTVLPIYKKWFEDQHLGGKTIFQATGDIWRPKYYKGQKVDENVWEVHHIRPLEYGGLNRYNLLSFGPSDDQSGLALDNNYVPLRNKDHKKFTNWFTNY
jgi:hypothetical protein